MAGSTIAKVRKAMRFVCILLLSIFAFAIVAPSSHAGCQDPKKQDEPKKEPTEESKAALQEAIDGLAEALKDKEESTIKEMIDKITTKYEGGDASLQGKAVSALKKCLKNKVKSIRNAAIVGLSNTGGSAIKILLKGAKTAKKDAGLQQRYINAAGKLRDEKAIGDITKYLNNKNNNTIKSAIYALGYYNESSTKVRKDIVKSLLKVYASVASAFSKPNPDTSDKEKYEALFNPFESTLKKLTKQEMQGADVWNRWFRKDGKKRKEW
ncbi:MAG: HEAT repeat protein [Planctomycetota bacterium]